MTDNESRSTELSNPAAQEAFLQMMQQAMTPLFEALNQMVSTQQTMNNRIESLEKQNRLAILVTPQQVRLFNEAIKKRAREILFKRDAAEDVKAVRSLSNMIRKDVLTRYGASALHDIPKHEYGVVQTQVQTWNDALCIRDVMRGVRERAEANRGEDT